MPREGNSKLAVYAALAGNVAVGEIARRIRAAHDEVRTVLFEPREKPALAATAS